MASETVETIDSETGERTTRTITVPDPTPEQVNQTTLRQRARQALAINATYAAAAKPGTAAAQASAAFDATQRHAQQINRVIRLLLNELDGTD